MRVVKLIAFLLCLTLTVPMLFACDKKESEEQKNTGIDYVDKGLLPDYRCTVSVSANVTHPGDPDGDSSFSRSQDICFNNGNFYISFKDNGIDLSLTYFHKVFYLNAYGIKYKLDINDLDIKTLIALALNTNTNELRVEEAPAVLLAFSPDGMAVSDRSSADAKSGNSVFKSVAYGKDEDGNDVATYTGLKSRAAKILDRLIAYVMERSGSSGNVVINYDELTITVTTDDGLDVLGATLDANIEYRKDGETAFCCELKLEAYYEYGSSDPVTVPEEKDTYKDALPEIMKLISAVLS